MDCGAIIAELLETPMAFSVALICHDAASCRLAGFRGIMHRGHSDHARILLSLIMLANSMVNHMMDIQETKLHTSGLH